MQFYRPLYILPIVALVAASGCFDSSDLVDDGKAVSGVEISPDRDTVANGSTIQFSATLRYADGTSKDVTRDVDMFWNTSDVDIATVSEGLVVVKSVGVVEIVANYKGEEGTEHFIVTP